MRNKTRNLTQLSLVLFFMIPAFVGRADDRARDRESLRGLGILNVRTKFLDSEPPQKTFTTAKEEAIARFDPKKRYVYAIRLNLRQLVSLQRTPEATAFSITWQTESVGLRRLALIREDFENAVNVFIEAYFSENPGMK